MIFKSKVKYLNKENKVSKQGNNYIQVLLMQGNETFTCMSDVDIQGDFGKEFIGEFDLNLKYKSVKLIGIDK